MQARKVVAVSALVPFFFGTATLAGGLTYKIVDIAADVDACDICPTFSNANRLQIRPHALNDEGRVVGTVICRNSSFLYAATAFIYDQSTGTFELLPFVDAGPDPTCANFPDEFEFADEFSGAYDINNDDVIVGWGGPGNSVAPIGSGADAVYWEWTLSSTSVTRITDTSDIEVAYGVSPVDGSGDFHVAAMRRDLGTAFTWNSSAPTVITELAALSGDDIAIAYGVDSDGVVSGGSGVCGLLNTFFLFDASPPDPECVPAQFPTWCERHSEGVVWDTSASALDMPDELTEDPGDTLVGMATRIGENGSLVGWGREAIDCSQPSLVVPHRAVFWKSDSATATNLHLATPDSGTGFDSTEDTFAYNINDDPDAAMIVGEAANSDTPVLWYDDDLSSSTEDWRWANVADLTLLAVPDITPFRVADVNNCGWITGWGEPNGLNGFGAYLGIPVDDAVPSACPEDTNDDGVVDVQDLINVILAWDEMCKVVGGSINCRTDVNQDGRTDKTDLDSVIDEWGPCPTSSATVDSICDEFIDAGLTQDDCDDFLDGTADVEDENYRCWLEHYLTYDCCLWCPTCESGCPGADPFD